MKPRLVCVVALLATGVTAVRAAPPDLSSYRARVALDPGAGPPGQWTDIVVVGNGDVHKRACELAAATELRILAKLPDVKGGVVRACALEPLPPVAAAAASRYLLIQPHGSDMMIEAVVTSGHPLPEGVRARITSFTPYSSWAACAQVLARLEAKRRESGQQATQLAAEWLHDQYQKATVERDQDCQHQREAAAECAALPPLPDVRRACKKSQSSRACRVATERAMAHEECEIGLHHAANACERETRLVEVLAKKVPPPPPDDDDPPSCQPG